MFYSCERSIPRKNSVVSIGKFPSLVLPRNAMMLQHLIIQFSLYYLSSGRLREVKNKRNFKLFALKVFAVVHERWWLTRGSKYSDLTWKRLHFGKLVAEERWSQPEVRGIMFYLRHLSVEYRPIPSPTDNRSTYRPIRGRYN